MSHIRILICRVDDPASNHMTELAAFDLPTTDVAALQAETALDVLETTTQETGNAILPLSGQVCSHPATQTHLIPGNAALPPHNGIIITRGLQEWACLLPQELPFVSVARLLGVPDPRRAHALRHDAPQSRTNSWPNHPAG